MLPADLTELTTAFNPTALLDTFISMAPFIVSIVGVIVAVSVVKWGFRKIKGKLSGGI